MPRIFISYSRVDTQFVKSLIDNLARLYGSENIWYDDKIPGGHHWWDLILEQVNWCDIFIYLLSNESVLSSYCQAEFEEAQRLQKHIITVQVRDRTKLDDELSAIQYVDMKPGVDMVDAYTRLYKAIELYKPPRFPHRPLWQPQTANPGAIVESQLQDRDEIDTPKLKRAIHHRRQRKYVSMPVLLLAIISILLILGLSYLVFMMINTGSELPTSTPTIPIFGLEAESTLPTATSISETEAYMTIRAIENGLKTQSVMTATYEDAQTATEGVFSTATARVWTDTPSPTLELTIANATIAGMQTQVAAAAATKEYFQQQTVSANSTDAAQTAIALIPTTDWQGTAQALSTVISQQTQAVQTEIVEDIANTDFASRVRPLRPGYIFSTESTGGATIGAFLRNKEGEIFVASSSLSFPFPDTNMAVLQPSSDNGGLSPDDIVGYPVYFDLEIIDPQLYEESFIPEDIGNRLLLDLVKLNSDVEFDPTIPGIGPIQGIATPTLGMFLRKVGGVTGYTEGTLTVVNVTVDIKAFSSTTSEPYTLRQTGVLMSTNMSTGLDSGAFVLDGNSNAVGMIIAGSNAATIIMPIQRILELTGLELCTTEVKC